jgi:hypothetical protein
MGSTLPESASLLSTGDFAERFFSGAKKFLCRVPKKHSAQQFFKPRFGALNEFK